MSQIHYLIGDALKPVKTPTIICHCNNDAAGWGRGFVLAISKMWPEPEKAYREWFVTGKPRLGDVQFVQVTPDITIANMIGQHGTQWQGKIPPIRYDALEKGFKQVYERALAEKAIISMPRVGCVLAGGSWNVIGPMTVETYVYTLENQKDRWKDKYEN